MSDARDSDIIDWQLADVLVDRRALFILWTVKTLFCTRREDFLRQYDFEERDLDSLLHRLTLLGFLQLDGADFVLTAIGEVAIASIEPLEDEQTEALLQTFPDGLAADILAANRSNNERQSDDYFVPSSADVIDGEEDEGDEEILESYPALAERGVTWDATTPPVLEESEQEDEDAAEDEEDEAHVLENLARPEADIEARFSLPGERIYVEERLLAQLQQMGWTSLADRDPETPYLAAEGRASYREVLLEQRLRDAMRRLNSGNNQPVPTEAQLSEAIQALRTLMSSGRPLLEINEECFMRLQEGVYVSGTPDYQDGRDRHLIYLAMGQAEHFAQNDFFVLNQFRVEVPGKQTAIIPDVVLFVNGIPLVVIECKSPGLTDPIGTGVAQLRRYASQEEGVPTLFATNAFLISTCFYNAKAGTLGMGSEDYQLWKDPYPLKKPQLAQNLDVDDPQRLSGQQLLVAGMLRKENLLDLLQNFILFSVQGQRKRKLIARYQQYRAVRKAIQRLQTGKPRTSDHDDERGGVIWHTQGSGKSLTMVFLIRTMRKLPKLSTFKIIIITDRQDLQTQLAETMATAQQHTHIARTIQETRRLLAQRSDDIVFVMIQKARADLEIPTLPELDPSPDILLIVDEAHRSHSDKLHQNIMNALPNSAKIGFTGTPIVVEGKKRTIDIFGPYIDTYTILQSEQDGATVPILYEGYQAFGIVVREQVLDDAYEYIMKGVPHELRRRIASDYSGEVQVIEALEFIEAKAHHMLLHYTANILPDSFKALIVTQSREAAVRYQAAIVQAKADLQATFNRLDSALFDLPPEQRSKLPQGTQLLLQAYQQRERLAQLECAALISHTEGDELTWNQWSDERQRKQYIDRFKLPLPDDAEDNGNNTGEVSGRRNEQRSDALALLCVQRMLLTGFDAPILQALYLDQKLAEHNLLQAIARVNRTYPNKTHGLVVDYRGIARQLKEALNVYTATDVQGALTNIQDELLKLEARHLRVKAIFKEQQIDISTIQLKRDIAEIDACLNLLEDRRIRADFEEKLRKFLESMDAVLPRPQASRYIHDMQVLGYIHDALANMHPEEQISIAGTGKKVRKLIDEHIEVLGIEQTIQRISITDPQFEQQVERHKSDQTKALQMEHLARYYISEHFDEAPEYYQRFSERLEDILARLKDQWSELVRELSPYVQALRAPRPEDPTGLDVRTQLPFLDILAIEASRGSEHYHIAPTDVEIRDSILLPDQREDLARLTVELIDTVILPRIRRVDFWRGSMGDRELSVQIFNFLDNKNIITPYERIHAVANRLKDLARRLHRWLVVS